MPRWYRHYQLEGTKGTGRRIQNRRCGVVVVDMVVVAGAKVKVKVKVKVVVDMEVSGM